jgi:hypothetical protein
MSSSDPIVVVLAMQNFQINSWFVLQLTKVNIPRMSILVNQNCLRKISITLCAIESPVGIARWRLIKYSPMKMLDVRGMRHAVFIERQAADADEDKGDGGSDTPTKPDVLDSESCHVRTRVR